MEQVYIEKEECCGCTACYAICPTHAISMEADEKGFQYPVIDQSICIDCGLCKKVCRFSKPIDNEFDIQQFFALKHRDPEVLKNSQSGGAFTVFSDYILENKGSVFGAFFDKDNFYIYHTKAETEEARNLQRGSKYVQSDLNDCFLSVKKDLQVGKKVLFSGTPCQCDGLISFLVKSKVDTKDLYVIDLICHGVPSQKIFRDYIKFIKQKYNSDVINFAFREKKLHFWGQYIEEIVLKNGKYVYSDWFVNIFFNDSSLRECCYKCPYTSPVSNADVTIGDFWGIDRCIPDMYNKYGVSAVIIHSEKGRFLFDKVKNCSFYKEVKKADLVTPQPMLYSAVVKPKRYNLFWKNYFDKEFKIFLKRESFNSLTKINIIKLCLYKLLKIPYRVLKKIYKLVKS